MKIKRLDHISLVVEDIESAAAFFTELGLRSVMFTVEQLDDVVTHMQKHGGELIGEVGQYKDMYRLCYMRGSGNTIVSPAEELFI